MSQTLSLLAMNAFDDPYSRSNSISTTSNDTIYRHSCRISSFGTSSLPLDENHPPPRHVHSSGNIAQSWKRPPLRTVKSQLPARLHWETKNPAPKPQAPERIAASAARPEFNLSQGSLESISLEDDKTPEDPFRDCSGLAELEGEDPLLPKVAQSPQRHSQFDPVPFRRWLSKLRRSGGHRKSDSHSTGVVSAVRTATMTLAESTIAAPRSWLGHRFGHARGSGSKHESHDSNISPLGVILDEAAYSRSVQRRRILEELIDSEENYLGDLKVLSNVYFTLLASVCALSTHAKVLVRENLTQLLQIHEDILGGLHSVVPNSEYNHMQAKETPAVHYKGHVRWHSADSGITKLKDSRFARGFRHSVDLARPPKQSIPGLTADPTVAADVAKVFEKHMQSFFAYEEYGAKYDLMARDLASTYQTLGTDDSFEKGIEVLSRTLDSMKIRSEHGRKGMTFSDLVIKPIQRMCRYPLLFAELLKYTPVSDDPEAHAQVEKIFYRLREATAEINRATEDPSTRLLIEKTWLLQDKLVFSDDVLTTQIFISCLNEAHVSVKNRLLGHVLLCGVLHVAYQARKGPEGQYMLCTLFKSCLVLAIPQKGTTMFEVVAIIPILNISIEEPDNGKGLQCHTASFTWKVIFQAGHRLFEFMFSACSPMEEEQWRKHLHQRNVMEDLDSSPGPRRTYDICECLVLDLKPLGTVYGQANTLVRRISIHRAATLVAKSHMHQVIIKHTESAEYSTYSSSTTSLPLARSKSIASAGHIPVLAPRRSERIHLEAVLSNIWTHELLPYPGMKSDNPFKASANHMMRKLSMASLSSSFSKRTSTFISNSRPPLPESRSRPRTPIEFAMDIGRRRSSRSPSKQSAKPIQTSRPAHVTSLPPGPAVNFQDNPDKFLPPDFELKDPRLNKPPRKNLKVRTMTGDGFEVVPPEKKKSYHRLQRSLSAKMSGMKEVAERFRPPTPQSPKHEKNFENQPLKEVTSNKAVGTAKAKKLRKLFS